jgi:putative MATE family efflux protein
MENTFNEASLGTVIFKFTLPLSLEVLVGYFVNSIDTFMVGRLGETAIAAVGIANQFYYLLTFVFVAICNSSIIFASQYWGKKDFKSLHKLMGISLTVNVTGACLFSFAAIAFPRYVVEIFTSNPEVISLGASYLRIKGMAYIVMAISSCYLIMMKSTGNAIFPLLLSASSLVVNIILNYALIYGKLGFAAMGVSGAATVTCILSYAECIVLLGYIYTKRLPIAARMKDLLGFDRVFAARFFKVSLPVMINDIAWSFGIVIYNWIYARIGVEAIAAVNICTSIEGIFTTLFVGMTNTCSILLGNYLGAGSKERAYKCGRNFLVASIAGSIVMGFILIFCSKGILSFYVLSTAAYNNARYLMIITGCIFFIKVPNIMLIVGIIRSGGDTRFPMILDLSTMWGVGIPLALIGTFVFHLPVYWVMVLVGAEEVSKMIGGLKRFFSKKWITNIVSQSE